MNFMRSRKFIRFAQIEWVGGGVKNKNRFQIPAHLLMER